MMMVAASKAEAPIETARRIERGGRQPMVQAVKKKTGFALLLLLLLCVIVASCFSTVTGFVIQQQNQRYPARKTTSTHRSLSQVEPVAVVTSATTTPTTTQTTRTALPTSTTAVSPSDRKYNKNKNKNKPKQSDNKQATKKKSFKKKYKKKWTSNKANNKKGNSNSSSKSSSKNKKKSSTPRLPWKAGYYTSVKTQGLLKEAATAQPQGATAVLQTLLSTAPERCNAANLVCALTFSARQLQQQQQQPSFRQQQSQWKPDEFRAAFYQVLGILQEQMNLSTKAAVQPNQAPKQQFLSPRQLCNSLWAIAKICESYRQIQQQQQQKRSNRQPSNDDNNDSNNRDLASSLLPPLPKQVALSTEQQFGVAEEWNVFSSTNLNDDTKTPQRQTSAADNTKNDERHEGHLIHQVVDEISQALIPILQHNSTLVKNGELCMTCWALGILRERHRPPGWKTRPRLGQVPKSSTANQSPSATATTRTDPNNDDQDTIKIRYEQWDSNPSSNIWKNKRQEQQNSFQSRFQWSQRSQERPRSQRNYYPDDEDEDEDEMSTPTSVSDELFEEIAVALSRPVQIIQQPPLSNGKTKDSQQDRDENEDNNAENDKELFFRQRIDTCRWSELANVAWAFATHGWSCSPSSEQLLASIANETVSRLQHEQRQALYYSPQQDTTPPPASRDVAQIIWSLGIAQSDNFRLAESLIQVVQALIVSYRSGEDEPSSFGVAAKNGEGRRRHRPFAHWSCADLVQVALSLAHARLDEQELLQALYEESIRRLPNQQWTDKNSAGHMARNNRNRQTLFVWEITILLWAQARLHLTSTQHAVFERFAEKATQSIQEAASTAKERGITSYLQSIGLGSQEKANLVWSLVILEQFHSPEAKALVSQIFVEASSACDVEGCMQLEHAHQMWQALFLLEHEKPEAVESTPKWFRDYLQSKWKQEKARPKLSSARHRALSQALTQMGVAHLNEHDEDIDVAIVLEPNSMWTHQATPLSEYDDEYDDVEQTSNENHGIRVAVEFDGPNHFTRPTNDDTAIFASSKPAPPRSLGHSVLKYRLLKKQGWNVIRVPYFEFDKIPFWASMERQRYLQRLLKTHSVLKFSDSDYSQYQPHVIPDRKSRFD